MKENNHSIIKLIIQMIYEALKVLKGLTNMVDDIDFKKNLIESIN